MTLEAVGPSDGANKSSFTAAVEKNIIGAKISPQAETVITKLGRSLSVANTLRTVNNRDELAQVRTSGLTNILTILDQKRLIDGALQYKIFSETTPDPAQIVTSERFDDGVREIYPGEPIVPLTDSWELGEKYKEKLEQLAPYIAVINTTIRGQPLGADAVPIVAEMGRDLHTQCSFLAKNKNNNIARDEMLGLFDVLLLLEQPELIRMATQS